MAGVWLVYGICIARVGHACGKRMYKKPTGGHWGARTAAYGKLPNHKFAC